MRVSPYEFWRDMVTAFGIVAATVAFASKDVIDPFVQQVILTGCFWIIIISITKMILYRISEYRKRIAKLNK